MAGRAHLGLGRRAQRRGGMAEGRQRTLLLDLRCHAGRAVLGMAMLCVGSATAGADMYRWVDESGGVHYSNVPAEVESEEAARRVVVESPPGEAPPQPVVPEPGKEEGGEASMVGDAEAAPSTSGEIALGRSALEREYRQTETRLAEIDRKLKAFADARLRFAKEGPASVGGLSASGAADVRSDAEEALEVEREELTKRLESIQTRYDALRARAAALYGGKTPPGWGELR